MGGVNSGGVTCWSELYSYSYICPHSNTTHSQAYYDAMDPDSVSIPLRLRGKREVVFGNLLDLYKFHDRCSHTHILATYTQLRSIIQHHILSLVVFIVCLLIHLQLVYHCSVFSKALDRYADKPERIGECFIQFVSTKLILCS